MGRPDEDEDEVEDESEEMVARAGMSGGVSERTMRSMCLTRGDDDGVDLCDFDDDDWNVDVDDRDEVRESEWVRESDRFSGQAESRAARAESSDDRAEVNMARGGGEGSGASGRIV